MPFKPFLIWYKSAGVRRPPGRPGPLAGQAAPAPIAAAAPGQAGRQGTAQGGEPPKPIAAAAPGQAGKAGPPRGVPAAGGPRRGKSRFK